MTQVSTRTLIAWYQHPGSHPLVVAAAIAELRRRGFICEGSNA